MNIAHHLIGQAQERPDAIALMAGASSISFGRLAEQSARGAALLRASGLGAGSRVLVFVPLSIELYVILTAIFRVGAAAVVIDPHAGRAHLQRCCEAAPPDALVAVAKAHALRLTSAAVRRIRCKFCVGAWLPGATRWPWPSDREQPDLLIAPRERTDAALMTFTSGSTGRPKCAVRTHGLLSAQLAALRESIDLTPGTVDFATLPIFTLANLAAGLTTVLGDWSHPAITRTVAAPAFFEDKPAPDRRLRRIYTGGGPVFARTLDRLRAAYPDADVTTLYGSTEAEPIAHIGSSALSPDDWQTMRTGRGLLVGTPVRQVRLAIIEDRAGSAIAPLTRQAFEAMRRKGGEIGEIVVTGDHVLKGYKDGVGDAETKFRVEDETWHRTGDAGYLDAAGRLWLVGRATAKVADEHGILYPLQVESVAMEDAGVRHCALVGLDGRRTLLASSWRSDRSDAKELRRRLLVALNPFHVQEVRIVPEIPMDHRHRSKIDYPSLRRMVAALEEVRNAS